MLPKSAFSSLLSVLLGEKSIKSEDLNNVTLEQAEEIIFPTLVGNYEGLKFFEEEGLGKRLRSLKKYILSQPTLIYYVMRSLPMAALYTAAGLLYSAGGLLANSQGRAYLKDSVKGLFSKPKEIFSKIDKESEKEFKEWMEGQGYSIKEREDGWVFYADEIKDGDPRKKEKIGLFRKAYPVLELKESPLSEEKIGEKRLTVVTDYEEEARRYVEELEMNAPVEWLPILVDVGVALEKKHFISREEYSDRLSKWEKQETEKLYESFEASDYKKTVESVEKIGERASYSSQRRVAEGLVERLKQENRKKDAKKIEKYFKDAGIIPPPGYRLPIAVGAGLGAWFTLDLTNTAILGVIPGPINLLEAIGYSVNTGLDWKHSVDLALHTDTLYVLGQMIHGEETEMSKAISICQQLEASKDEKAYDLVKFFLSDGRILPEEVKAANYFLQAKQVIPDGPRAYYTQEELGSIGYNLYASLSADGRIGPDEEQVLQALNTVEWKNRWWIVRDIYNSGMVESTALNQDWDKDGISNIAEIMNGTNPLNKLEVDPSNLSDRYAVITAVTGYAHISVEVKSVKGIMEFLYRNGYNDDNVFLVHNPGGAANYEIMKTFPIKVDYKGPSDSRATAEAFLNYIKNLPSDVNDQVFVYASAHGNVNYIHMGGNVHFSEFGDALKQMDCGEAVVVINCSNAGGYVENLYNYLEKNPNMLIIGTQSKTESLDFTLEVTKFVGYLDSGLSIEEAFNIFAYELGKKGYHPVMYSGREEPFTNFLVYKKSQE